MCGTILRLLVVCTAFMALPAAAQTQTPPAQNGAPPAAALPQDPAARGAEQVVGLFMDTCVHFAADPAGLRSWLAKQGVPELPAEARRIFLGQRQGKAYDTSVENTRLALVSADDGSCSAYSEFADPEQLAKNLEDALRQADDSVTLQGAHADARDPTLAHRDYRATIGARQFLVLLTTTKAPGKLQAALTLRPQ